MNTEKISNFYSSHRGGINGALAGFVIAVTILIIGFFRTFFIGVCVGVGYYIGVKLFNDKDYIKDLLDKVLPPGTYR